MCAGFTWSNGSDRGGLRFGLLLGSENLQAPMVHLAERGEYEFRFTIRSSGSFEQVPSSCIAVESAPLAAPEGARTSVSRTHPEPCPSEEDHTKLEASSGGSMVYPQNNLTTRRYVVALPHTQVN
jgi:hypothetical protein